MRHSIGWLLAKAVLMALLGLVMLAGCEKTLKGHDPFSPTADVRIDAVTNSGLIRAVVSTVDTIATTGVRLAIFQDTSFRVLVFNGVPVQFTRYMVEYFEVDGVTPVGIPPLVGGMNVFIAGGVVGVGLLNSIAPSATTATLAGSPAVATISLPLVSLAMRDILACPRTGACDAGRELGVAPDNSDQFVGVLTLLGEDINRNDVRVSAKLTISPVVVLGTSN